VITSSGGFTVFGCSANTDAPGAGGRALHRQQTCDRTAPPCISTFADLAADPAAEQEEPLRLRRSGMFERRDPGQLAPRLDSSTHTIAG
jgi:hypothetical protein